MKVHLIDGTYELFRHYYAMPSQLNETGQEVAATRGVASSVLGLLSDGATHVAVATDHVIESFRNELWPGYKDGSGIEPALRSQFDLLEETLRALGITVWAMVEYEADDALGAGAQMAAADPRVDEVLICTPDKDLAQCVEGQRVVQLDRRKRQKIDAEGVHQKFGVYPPSIPDYLALVGDSADGFPGLRGWGAKSSAVVLDRYQHIECIPDLAMDWSVEVRGAMKLASTLKENRELAFLFRRIATIVRDAPASDSVDELEWTGPTADLEAISAMLGAPDLVRRSASLASGR